MKTIETRADLQAALARIAFAPSCIGLEKADLEFEARDETHGWSVRLTFTRPDTTTGVAGRGAGRWEMIDVGISVTGAIKTCWLLLELLVRHELMESFLVDEIRVFDPHKTLSELQWGARSTSS